MDRYFLIVVTSDGSDSEMLSSGLNSLVATFPYFMCEKVANCQHEILHPASVYYSTISGSSNPADVCWKRVHLQSGDAEQQYINGRNGDILADCVHALADSLPNLGIFLLDVVWIIVGEDGPSPERNVELYGAFKRLQIWHRARFTICHHKGRMFSTHPAVHTSDWVEMLGAETVPIGRLGPLVARPGAVWTGNFCWWDKENCQMKPFGLFCMRRMKSESCSKCPEERIRRSFSGQMFLLSVCDSNSVPLHLIGPRSYELQVLSADPAVTELSIEFLKLLNYGPNGKCAILRLSYGEEDVGGPIKSEFSTENWRNEIAAGVMRYPKWNATTDVEYVHFFLADGVMYQMRHPAELSGLPCHRLTLLPVGEKKPGCDFDSDQILSHLAHFKGHQLRQLRNIMDSEEASNGNDEILSLENVYFSRKFSELGLELDLGESERSMIFTEIEENGTRAHSDSDELEDANRWAEMNSLRFRGLLTEPVRRYKSTDTLGGFAPPLAATKILVTTVSDILTSFKKSGEAKIPDIDKLSLFRNGKTWRINSADQQSAQLAWPRCKLSLYHDVYYNRGDEAEKAEQRSIGLRERFLSVDTISTRDEFAVPDAGNEGVRDGKEKFVARKDRGTLRRSPRKRKLIIVPEPIPKKKRVERRTSAKVDKTVSSKENESLKTSRPKLDETPEEERLKKKLRVAVVEALESKGIGLTDPLFNTCGRKLFTICRAFAKDVVGKGKTSVQLKKIADSHVMPVIEFCERLRQSPRCKRKA